MAIALREIGVDELHKVSELSHEIWPIAYKDIITKAQIDFMLSTMYSQQSLEQNIANGHRFLLAEQDHKALGFAGFQHQHPKKGTTKIHKLYVKTDLQGQGVGSLLLKKVAIETKINGDAEIELQVNKINTARFFYEKLGFFVDHEAVFDIGHGFFMDDYIMKLRV